MNNYTKKNILKRFIFFAAVGFLSVVLLSNIDINSLLRDLFPPALEFGILTFDDGSFTGYHRNELPVSGVRVWDNGSRFEGEWLDSEEHDRIRRGRIDHANGNHFIGDAVASTGSLISGTFVWASGIRFEGVWLYDPQHGRIRVGTRTAADGTTLTGTFNTATGNRIYP